MKKKVLCRGGLGFFMGVSVSCTISIIISIIIGGGEMYFVVPYLIGDFGSEVGAVLFQYFLSGFLGSVFAMVGLVFEAENFSLLKQTSIHFIISVISIVFVSYNLYWMERSFAGVFSYLLIFILIYIAIWTFQYILQKRNLEIINKELLKNKGV